MKKQTRFDYLPFELQMLVWEYTGEHQSKMKQVLKDLMQRNYRQQIIDQFNHTNGADLDRCDYCGKEKLVLADCGFYLHRLNNYFICSNSCDKKLRAENPEFARNLDMGYRAGFRLHLHYN